MDTEQDDSALMTSGERFAPGMRGHIRLEHLHRYFIAKEFAREKQVLEIACGEGYGADLLAEVADQVIGIDIADDVITRARTRYRRSNLDFQVGRCEAIPLATASVDLIVSFETIEHLQDHDGMMRELKRFSRPTARSSYRARTVTNTRRCLHIRTRFTFGSWIATNSNAARKIFPARHDG